ncbi:hypothetical protein M2475_001847 [Breznakia sp. PF5-3]|uniref:reverse transcriptase domain-containing protein n=1 Tax=unclassified Breznakia TaxID=2623764 RepID=UPI002404AE22|nr:MULTISPECIES: reverse transcriptase domain-containing protein [unclassified Breznakia]MDF9825392.1 hypothetical protein [Breznakia sp. PM6-1]MDF9836270.1 hypothetical protein [Breznakia sp. PF5-3]MDF9837578.1 hypothetical protein [Breznakia sp. PFB2-8]MDF9860191.1 hypothetical protein [Breznakia sp. PH5-24]
MDKIKINKSALYACSSKVYLAKILSNYKKGIVINQRELRRVKHFFDNEDKVFYKSKTTGEIFSNKPANYSPKKYRKFNDPSIKRKEVLRRLNFFLKQIETPKYLFSVKDKDYVKNAKIHRGNSHYIMLDITSFFPNCDYRNIFEWLLSDSGLAMKPDIATCICDLVTSPRNGQYRELPQGYPTSTLIAYFSYKKMFDEIATLAKLRGLKFSTYVDDLTFSYNDNIQLDNEFFILEIKQLVSKYGHSLNDKEKIYDCSKHYSSSYNPLITGVFVKRWKIRASRKLHSKMIKKYNKLINLKIIDSTTYFEAWEMYQSLQGICISINTIEPQKTKKNRQHILNYIENNKKKFPFETNIKRIKELRLEKKIYDAYRSGTLREFISKHSNIIF